MLAENHVAAQKEAPAALTAHGDELDDLRAPAGDAGKNGEHDVAEDEVPAVQGDEHEDAAQVVARCFEGDVAVHEGVVGTRGDDGEDVGQPRS